MFKPFTIERTPKNTKVPKPMILRSSPAEGKLHLTLWGGWTELEPQAVQEVIRQMFYWLGDLFEWECDKCGTTNYTNETNQIDTMWVDYKWVRCQNCKKKTDRDKLRLTKADYLDKFLR